VRFGRPPTGPSAQCLRLAAGIEAAADKLKALAVRSLEEGAELENDADNAGWPPRVAA
jgi:hypothetical protein